MGRPIKSAIRNHYEYDKINNESKCKICSAKLKVSIYYTLLNLRTLEPISKLKKL